MTTSFQTSAGYVALAHLFFVTSGLLALLAAFSGEASLYALLSLVAGGMLLAKQREFAVDRSQRRYRYYVSFFGLPIGPWQPLPLVTRVVLKPYSEYERSTPSKNSWNSGQTTGPRQSCVVLLSVEASSQGIVVGKAPAAREAKARQTAQELAAYLGVELWEAE